MWIRYTASGCKPGPITDGFESMMSTVLSRWSGDLNKKRSMMSRRASSPGNLKLSALKWLDMGESPVDDCSDRHSPMRGTWSGRGTPLFIPPHALVGTPCFPTPGSNLSATVGPRPRLPVVGLDRQRDAAEP